MTQLEYLKLAVKMAEENPGMEIRVAASSDELLDDVAWTMHKIISVEKSLWYVDNENILTDVDEIIDHLNDSLDVKSNRPDYTEEEAIALSKEVILIRTGA